MVEVKCLRPFTSRACLYAKNSGKNAGPPVESPLIPAASHCVGFKNAKFKIDPNEPHPFNMSDRLPVRMVPTHDLNG